VLLNKPTRTIKKLVGTHKVYKDVVDENTGEVKTIVLDELLYEILGERDTNFMKMFYKIL